MSERKLHIVHFITSLATGGAETLVKDYAINFNKRYRFTVIAMSRRGNETANEKQLKEHNIGIVYLSDLYSKPSNILSKVIALIKGASYMSTYIKAEKVSVVHSHLSLNIYLYLIRHQLKGVKLFHTVHNEPRLLFEKNIYRKLEKRVTNYLVHKNNLRLIALHEPMKQELDKMFHVDNTVIINNGINLERFQRSLYYEQMTSIRNELGFSNDDFVVGHVGRFNFQKNHQFLITVFTALIKEKPNAKLLLIGSGELKPAVLQQIADNHIEDRVVLLENRRDIPELMSIMDVFLFPSNWEGLGIVLVEAQAMGLKCVVSDRVPSAVYLTDRIRSLSLQSHITAWCDAVICDDHYVTAVDTLTSYDMKNIVCQLEELYES